MAELTEYETNVLTRLSKIGGAATVGGNKQVAIVACLHRLEKKGMVGKSSRWYITAKGKNYLEELAAAQTPAISA